VEMDKYNFCQLYLVFSSNQSCGGGGVMSRETSELRALLKMIRDFGGSASWPVLVNNCSKYGIPLLDLKPLLEIAKQRGLIKEEAGVYTLVRAVRH